MRRLTDAEIQEVAAWTNSRRYDVATDRMVTDHEPPAVIAECCDDATRLWAALTVVRPRPRHDRPNGGRSVSEDMAGERRGAVLAFGILAHVGALVAAALWCVLVVAVVLASR